MVNTNTKIGHPLVLTLNGLSVAIGVFGLIRLGDLPLPQHLQGAGKWQFLTNLSLMYSIGVFFLGFLSHLFKSQRLYNIKNNVHAIGFVLEIVVFLVYWPLKLFFIDILAKDGVVGIDIITDLSIHFMPVVSLGIDFFLFMPNWSMSTNVAFSSCLFLTSVYWVWLHYLIDFEAGGRFPYEFLNVENVYSRAGIFCLVGMIGFSQFLLMRKVYNMVNREKVEKVE